MIVARVFARELRVNVAVSRTEAGDGVVSKCVAVGVTSPKERIIDALAGL